MQNVYNSLTLIFQDIPPTTVQFLPVILPSDCQILKDKLKQKTFIIYSISLHNYVQDTLNAQPVDIKGWLATLSLDELKDFKI